MLAATIGNTVEILRWNEEERALQLLCDYSNNIMALYLKTHGDFLLVWFRLGVSSPALLLELVWLIGYRTIIVEVSGLQGHSCW